MDGSLFLSHFETSLATVPDAVAFDIGGVETTYRDFARKVQSIRDVLEARAQDRRIPVAVYATQEMETYAAIVAILATGRAYLPLNPKSPPTRNASCLMQAEATTLLCRVVNETVAAWAEDAAIGVEPLPTADLAPSDWKAISPVAPEDLAYLLFTSGSTGLPKGVPIYHRNLNTFLTAILEGTDWNVTAEDRVLQMFDLTFDLSVMSYALPLCVGATCVVVPEGGQGFVGVARTLQRGRVSVALMVPSVLSFLERYFDEIALPHLRLSMFCGEALPSRLARKWWLCAPGARLLNVYGPTEATIFLSSYELQRTPSADDEYNGVVGIGQPLPGSSFRVVDENLDEVAEGERGELILMGGQVTDGYWRNPEKTKAAFIVLPDGIPGYRSGDVAFRKDSLHYYAGRLDHQIKIDGYRVESGEVEERARKVPGVRDATLVPLIEGGRIIAIHLFVLVEAGMDPGFAIACRKQMAADLPGYMVPQKVHLRTEFPLNANGKVDRNALAAQLDVQ